MSHNDPKLPEAESVFCKVMWRSVTSIAGPAQEFTSWTITGVAAIVSMLISNIDSAAKILAIGGIKAAVVMFALSLLFGAASKILGMAGVAGQRNIQEIEGMLNSEPGRRVMDSMNVTVDQLGTLLSTPFVWPMKEYMRSRVSHGAKDPLAADKMYVKILCWQIYTNFFHIIFAVTAVLILALSIGEAQ